MSDQGDLLELW